MFTVMTKKEKQALETMLENINNSLESLMSLDEDAKKSYDEWAMELKQITDAYPYKYGYVCSGIKTYANRIITSIRNFNEKVKM